MNKAKQKMLEKKGWKVGTAEEFLGLSPAESRCIERKVESSKTGSGHTSGRLVTTRGHVHWRITEYGAVNLHGMTLRGRDPVLLLDVLRSARIFSTR